MASTNIPLPSRSKQKDLLRRSRGFWLRQLHSWHWISSAVALAGLLLFTISGVTLNHAADIEAEPDIVQTKASLDSNLLALMEPFAEGDLAPIPGDIRQAAGRKLDISIPDTPAEWSEFEVYLTMPRPGGDAWLSIDRKTGAIVYEKTDRGWIAYLNDLHKGRDTGVVWRWFIDIFAAAATVFIVTGFVLLFMHSRNRPATWPVTGLGLVIPVLLILLFVH